MGKLESRLKDWVAAGLLSAEQAKRIREHEGNRPESSWVLFGTLLLGAVIIAIGTVSLVAANWYLIPPFVKLAVDFAILGALAAAAVACWKKEIAFEVLLLVFLLHCMATIGLISQVFHLGGKFYEALLLWSALTFAASQAARYWLVPFLWTGALLTGLVSEALDGAFLQPLFQHELTPIFMAAPLLCAGLTVFSRSMSGESGPTRASRFWTLLGGLVALGVAEIWQHGLTTALPHLASYLPGYVLAIFVALSILFSAEYRSTQKSLLLAVLLLFLTTFHLPFLVLNSAITYAVCTIATLALMAIFLASLRQRKLFQAFLFLIGLRFLVLYFQALGGLATTGVGLILSGLLVITMAGLWQRYRVPLAQWSERWTR